MLIKSYIVLHECALEQDLKLFIVCTFYSICLLWSILMYLLLQGGDETEVYEAACSERMVLTLLF